MAKERQIRSTGQSAWLIAAAALIPLFLFLLLQAGFSALEQRRELEDRADRRSQSIILRADGEVRRLTTIIDALATSTALERGDIDAFRTRYQRFAARHSDLAGVTVTSADGRLVMREGVAVAGVQRVAGKPAATGFAGYARSAGCHCLLFESPAIDGAGRKLMVSLLVRAEPFAALLPAASEYTVSALSDAEGRFVARSLQFDHRFATLGSTYLRDAIRSGQAQGIYKGRTLEGVENYTAFTRSSLTGWSAHVALGSDYLDRQGRRFLASMGFAALLSLLLAALLILFAVRQMRAARRMAERLEQAQKMEALGQLTGGLAHDFNNLLTPVIGTLDQLQRRDSLDERGRMLAAGALSSAQRAAKLTKQLLAFSRRQRLAIEPLDVGAMVEEVRDLVMRSLGPRHDFQIELDPQASCARSDRNQLELALLNLTLNARDASSEGGPILLSVVRETDRDGGEWVRFSVRDEGSGMDEETRRRAFEPFFTTKEVGRGTGLGLAQVFGVVEQSGGSVSIDSAPGEGTCVSLRLPACDSDEAAAIDAAAIVPVPVIATLRILVVDDEPDVRAAVSRMLDEAGHSVDAVASGSSALAALANERFDLLVTDYLMPGMTGIELIERAAALRPQLRFLIITGFADSDMLERAPSGTVLLAKPFTGDELLEAAARTMA